MSAVDRLGQAITPGCKVVYSFVANSSLKMHIREVERVVKTRVYFKPVAPSKDFSHLGAKKWGEAYNSVVIDRLTPSDSGTSTREMIGRELGYGH